MRKGHCSLIRSDQNILMPLTHGLRVHPLKLKLNSDFRMILGNQAQKGLRGIFIINRLAIFPTPFPLQFFQE